MDFSAAICPRHLIGARFTSDFMTEVQEMPSTDGRGRSR